MGRQSSDASSGAGGPGGGPATRMQRSQSRLSLSASFEALVVYFPCVGSYHKGDAGETACVRVWVCARMCLCGAWVCVCVCVCASVCVTVSLHV